MGRTRLSATTWEELAGQFDEIRKKGYALDLEENVEGIVCVGAPIFDYSGRVVGAVSVSCPTVRGDMPRLLELKNRLLELKNRLLEACTRISADCGYYVAER